MPKVCKPLLEYRVAAYNLQAGMPGGKVMVVYTSSIFGTCRLLICKKAFVEGSSDGQEESSKRA